MEKDPATSSVGKEKGSRASNPNRPPKAPGSSPFVGMGAGSKPNQPPPLPNKGKKDKETREIAPVASPPYQHPTARQLEPPDIYPAPKQPGPEGSLMPSENIAFFVMDAEEPSADEQENEQETPESPYRHPTQEEQSTLSHPMDVFFMLAQLPKELEEKTSEVPLDHMTTGSMEPLSDPSENNEKRSIEEAKTLDIPALKNSTSIPELKLEQESISIHTSPSSREDEDISLLSTQEVPVINKKKPRGPLNPRASKKQQEDDLASTIDDIGSELDLEGLQTFTHEDNEVDTDLSLEIIDEASSRRTSSYASSESSSVDVLVGTIVEEELGEENQTHDGILDDFEDLPTETTGQDLIGGNVDAGQSHGSLDGSALNEDHKKHTRKMPTLNTNSVEDLLEPGMNLQTPNPRGRTPSSSSHPSMPSAADAPHPATGSLSSLPSMGAAQSTSLTPQQGQCPEGELRIWLSPRLSLDTMSFMYQFAGQCQLMVQKAIPARPPRQAHLGCLYTEQETCLQWSGDLLLLQIILPSVLESFGQLQAPELKKIAETLQLREPLNKQSSALQVARQILIGTRPFAHALRDGISQLGQAQISLLQSALHGNSEMLYKSSDRTTPDPLREQRLMLSYQIQVNIPIQVLERRLEESFSLSLYQIVPKRLPLELIYLGVVHHFDLRNQLGELSTVLREIAPKLEIEPFNTYIAARKQRRGK